MARGWESKDVESQVESNQSVKAPVSKTQKTPEQLQQERERQGIELSRKRIMSDLENATNPNHRKSLEAALAHLDQKLSELK